MRTVYPNELYHHGILGQKWGVRRYQNPDGSLTPAGEKRYNEIESKNGFEKYKDTNLTKEDKFRAKYDNDKLKKAAMITGGVALTATALYLGKRFYQNNIDSFLKPGTTMQTIMDTPNLDKGRRFYTSINGLDKIRYGAIGKQLGIDYNTIYNHELNVGKQGLKIASNNSAYKHFKNLMNTDKKFYNDIEQMVIDSKYYANTDPFHRKVINRAYKDLDKGKITKSVYDMFNIDFAGSMVSESNRTKFFDALKKAGYAGVRDVNDMKYTNYLSINPAIIFDGINSISYNTVDKLSDKHYKAGYAAVMSQGISKKLVLPLASFVAPIKLYNKSKKNNNELKKVTEYREKHPDSKKTYTEIVKSK